MVTVALPNFKILTLPVTVAIVLVPLSDVFKLYISKWVPPLVVYSELSQSEEVDTVLDHSGLSDLEKVKLLDLVKT